MKCSSRLLTIATVLALTASGALAVSPSPTKYTHPDFTAGVGDLAPTVIWDRYFVHIDHGVCLMRFADGSVWAYHYRDRDGSRTLNRDDELWYRVKIK